MSGGGETTTTQQTTNEPWKYAQPALKMGLQDATNLYQAGIGSQPYTGSTVVPYANQSTQAFGNIQDIANNAMGADNPFSTAFSGVGNIAAGGFNDYQKQALSNLQQTASGNDIFGANPRFQNILRQAQDDVTNAVNMNASGLGRYGSGTNQQVLGDTLGNLTSQMLSDEYGRQLGRYDAATNQLFNAGQAGIGNQLSAASMLPDSFNAQLAPAQALSQVGGAYEDLATRQMNDQLRIFDEIQNAPWKQLGLLNAVASGSGQYGTSSTVAQQPNQGNPFGQIAGAGLALLSLL